MRRSIGVRIRDLARPRILLLGALLAAAPLLTACSTGPGPLAAGADWGGECGPGALGQPITDGMSLLYNTGPTPVTLTAIKLASPRGMAIAQAWVMPLYKSPRGTTDYAGTQSYPPTSWPVWRSRQPIPGAVIKPGQGLNLVFGLSRTAAVSGRTDGAIVTYTADRTSYTVQALFPIVLLAKHAHCPLP